jgi:hypothetical protein
MKRMRSALAPILAAALLAAPALAHEDGGRPHQHLESGAVATSGAFSTTPIAPLLVVSAIGLLLGASSLRRRSLERLRTA